MKKIITLCATLAIMTFTACGSDDSTQHRRRHVQTEDRWTDDIDWDEVDRLYNEIKDDNRQIEFMLCQLKLLNRIDLRNSDADAQMNSIYDDSKRDSIKAVCGLE